jgi:hypothetical protein
MEKNIDLIPFRANILKKHLEKKNNSCVKHHIFDMAAFAVQETQQDIW